MELKNCRVTFAMAQEGTAPCGIPCSRCHKGHSIGLYVLFNLADFLGTLCAQCLVDVVAGYLAASGYAVLGTGKRIPAEMLERAIPPHVQDFFTAADVLRDMQDEVWTQDDPVHHVCSHREPCSYDRTFCQDMTL